MRNVASTRRGRLTPDDPGGGEPVSDRDRLIDRIRQIRHTAAAADAGGTAPERDVIEVLDTRITHLEDLVQGLQDSVHREATRQEKRIASLEARAAAHPDLEA